jgi:glutaminyl-peptide cyclotransferase
MRHTAAVHRILSTVFGILIALSQLAPATAETDAAEGRDAVAGTDSPSDATSAVLAGAPMLAWEVVSRRPHDAAAWTQGLQLDGAGRLYESTGLEGQSTLREVDPETGAVLRSVALPDDQFGEGIAGVDDRLIQLTWKDGLAWSWAASTFEPLAAYSYAGEGWGLCFDGQHLVMSDGSDGLTFRDAATFEQVGSVAIVHDLDALRLNELECVDGQVWANAYQTDTIVRIDPLSGQLTGILDLAPLRSLGGAAGEGWDVLNGIAYDAAADTYLVTGKLWSELFEIRVLELGLAEPESS